MTIHTKQSFSGFIANDIDEPTFTSKGDARLYLRVGQPRYRLEQDQTFTKLEPEYADMVMFGRSAELAYEKFRKGDNFVAEGESRTYTGDDGVEREQFVASRIGHDNNLTRYTVDRSRPEREGQQQEAPGREQVQQALADREAQLDPDPPTATSVQPAQREALAR